MPLHEKGKAKMTSPQRDRIDELQKELRNRGKNTNINWKESNRPERLGFVFGVVNGVTVMVTPRRVDEHPRRSHLSSAPLSDTCHCSSFRGRAVGKAESSGRG